MPRRPSIVRTTPTSRRALVASLLLAAATTAPPASAQDIVMRRPLPNRQAVTGSPQSDPAGAHWRTTAWTLYGADGQPAGGGPLCGDFPERRDVACVDDAGTTVDEGRCSAQPRPETERTMHRDEGCGYFWAVSAWEEDGRGCSSEKVETRTVTCQRAADGAAVDDAHCGGDRPEATQTVEDYSACTYATSATPLSACTDGLQQVAYTCARVETGEQVKTHFCDVPKQATVACASYAWAPGDWTDVDACGPSGVVQQHRDVHCEAIEGYEHTQVDDSLCGGDRPADTGSRTCEPSTYAWSTSGYGDWSSHCGAATRTRQISCQRLPDGAIMDPDQSQCEASAGARPETQDSAEVVDGCTYSAQYDDWSACSDETQTRAMTGCVRSDGTSVPGDECVDRDQPATQSQACGATGSPAGPPVEITVGWCGRTSSGGGRYACGPYANYRPGPAAPAGPGALCTGNVLAGDPNDGGSDAGVPYQTTNAGPNWQKAPALRNVPGARCVVHYRAFGYSNDAGSDVWESVYYDGPPTGAQGGLFIGG